MDVLREQRFFERLRHPDVIEAAAAVRFFPVLITVGPPGVNFFLRWNEVARGVDPVERIQHFIQARGFRRRVRDDGEELLVRPDIVFVRRDVEVADGDELVGFLVALFEPAGHFIDEIELVFEFIVRGGVGDVAACRDVEIVQFKIFELCGDVAAILAPAAVVDVVCTERHA